MTPEAAGRVGAIDALRGLAIAGMVVFHLAWDLHDFGWTDLDPSRAFGWVLFGHAVAGCFLVLSGVSLVIAHRQKPGLRFPLRRIALIGGAALGVTLVTTVATPGEAVRFGILHCIAVSSLLALPLLGSPSRVVFALSGVAILVPFLVAGRAPAGWWWLGLSDQIPPTIDVWPLCPWFGVVLFGVWVGRQGGAAWLRDRWRERFVPRPLAVAGRHSLAIYLAHQPILFGLFWLLTALRHEPMQRADPATAFDATCHAACGQTTPVDQCSMFCACARRHLEQNGLRGPVNPGVLASVVRACGAGGSRPLDLHGP